MKMDNLIKDFTKHLEEGVAIGKTTAFSNTKVQIDTICITGLGGSGIGGTIMTNILSNQSPAPIIVNKGYSLPAFVNSKTLVIVSSYSGNTEETLSAIEKAQTAGAEICIITSGGKLLEIAIKNKYNYIQIPPGLPPRAAFGYSSVQILFALNKYHIITNVFEHELKQAIELLNLNEGKIQEEAKAIAHKMLNKIAVIYAEDSYEGVAIRFRQQINENAKALCWHHVIPEMNHNELVGWRTENENLAVVLFRTEDEFKRNTRRIEINKSIIEAYTSTIIEICAKGNTPLERSYYLIHIGDWISYFLAELKQIDAVEVNVITHLKSELAKM